jgi:hypothetical protein
MESSSGLQRTQTRFLESPCRVRARDRDGLLSLEPTSVVARQLALARSRVHFLREFPGEAFVQLEPGDRLLVEFIGELGLVAKARKEWKDGAPYEGHPCGDRELSIPKFHRANLMWF